MQMIDVLKRLAELDSTNPVVDTGVRIVQPNQNISINESQVEECGMMPMSMPMDKPHTPATLNISADSGEELGDMLGAIMQLAGLKNAEHDHDMDSMPAGDSVAQVSMEPEVDQTTSMRSMIDKLNPPGSEEGDEETDEGQYDNSPNDPRDAPEFDAEEFAHHENQPGAGHGRRTAQPNANPTAFESLMSEYKKFVAESE